MSTGFTFPWEQAAMGSEEMPEGLNLPDQMAFQALRCLYQTYHSKGIDRDTATREKLFIKRAFAEAVAEVEFQRKLALHHSQILRDTEAAKTACRKEPTPENALRLCRVLDGLERGGIT